MTGPISGGGPIIMGEIVEDDALHDTVDITAR
jgi:hypothetical protein